MTKPTLLLLTSAIAAFAQMPAIATSAPAVTVTIADQGPEPIEIVTGTKVHTARLLDATTCNESDGDESIDNAMVYQRVNTRTSQQLTLYDSQVVVRILAVFQDRNVFAKLFKAGTALSSVAAIVGAAFKLSPLVGAAVQIAPSIYSAVLPVVHSPEDLQALAADILPQNSGVKLAGHSCRGGLVIARTAGAVKTEVVAVK